MSDVGKEDALYRMRHSLAHVMAQAVLQLRPSARLGFGPPIDDGFYYDFLLTPPLTEDDFGDIEKRMRHIIRQRQPFVREEPDSPAVLAKLDGMGQDLKAEYAAELAAKGEMLSFYTNGPFTDLCRGPHVNSTGDLPEKGFKLRALAGAYWRADSSKAMMTRIYAWAFPTQLELDAHVKAWTEAQERDHKKLGPQLDLFVMDDVIGKGLPLWLPNGTILRDEIEKLARELEFKRGYQRVATPHLAKADLYHQTGHLPYYAKHMYPLMEVRENADDLVKEVYALKPMNCPHHHRIYAARPRSYRELPLRLAEYSHVYRFEDSGALSGLLRVRGMYMNDAHIYCTEDQLQAEFLDVMDLHRELYEILGLTGYYLRFSTWDPGDTRRRDKYVDDPQAWEHSQALIRDAMRGAGMQFEEVKGEAAFYGPKIDVQFKTVTGREETASTNQVDFAVPKRLGLTYFGTDGAEHTPWVIHRAPLGTAERFTAFLIERYGGAFPTWLAPVQVRLLTIVDSVDEFAARIVADLRSEFFRADLDTTGERINKKIRNALTRKIPNLLIIGARESAEGKVTLRRYGSEQQETIPLDLFKARLRTAVQRRLSRFPDTD